MKRFVLILFVIPSLVLVGIAEATITRVQEASGTGGASSGATVTATFSANPTPGNWIVGCVSQTSATRPLDFAISGATVGDYTPLRFPEVINGTSAMPAYGFYFRATTGATKTVTLSSANTFNGNLVVVEYSADRGLFPDIWHSATGSTSAVTTSASGTTNFNDELLVGCMSQRGQFASAQTGWLTSITGGFASVLQTSTNINTSNADTALAFLEQIVTSTGTYTAAGTGATQQFGAVLNTLYEPTATPTATSTSTPTNTPTPTPTATATASFTPCSCPPTPTPTDTPTPTATATNTATPTATATATSSFTPCSCPATPTPTPSDTPTPTATVFYSGGRSG